MAALPDGTVKQVPLSYVSMAVTLKCAACGAEVEFEELSPEIEETCPGCEVKVRYREGDEKMAIPVSMSLPEEFQHIDLDSVADKSSLLVGRYRKPAEGTGALNTDLVLARALESLATSIGHLEQRLSRQEGGGAKEDGPENSEAGEAGAKSSDRGSGDQNGVKVVSEPDAEGVVQLKPEKKEKKAGEGKGDSPIKAVPVGARVLVRREAAREASNFRREKHSQADWDEHSDRVAGPSGFAWLMERYPKATIMVTMLLAAGLIIFTIGAMNEMFAAPTGKGEGVPENDQRATLSELMVEDPEAAMAETVARGFLNATSVRTAAPFVYEADSIKEKFEKYYRPIPTPGEYDLKLKSRALAPGGQSIFAYRVAIPGEQTRMLVVLPEGKMPKVFWEFFAEVGDMTWAEFQSTPPPDPVVMRVWVHPGDRYFEPYDSKDWQSYILHDYGQKNRIYAYADRGASGDWRISDALENDPVQFNRHSAVMALVRITYMADLPAETGSGKIVELKEVLSTSWLPKRFQTPRKQ